MSLSDLPAPDSWPDVKAEIMLMRAELAAMRRELVLQRLAAAPAAAPPQPTRRARRDELLRKLAAATGLGPTKAGALQTLLVLTGSHPPPAGMEDTLAELRECGTLPTCWESVYRLVTR